MPRKRSKSSTKAGERHLRRKPTNVVPSVDESELNMFAGFTADGSRMATLREVLDPTIPTRNLSQLSEDHQFDLVAKRIEMRPEGFKLVIPGHGVIERERAVAEVRARTKIGRHLAEIEHIAMTRALNFRRTTETGEVHAAFDTSDRGH